MSLTDAWYPRAEDYWVPVGDAHGYPVRYGDMFATPDSAVCRTAKGKPWPAVLVLHPSCELGSKAADDTQVLVARINRVADIGSAQRPAVRTGWAERDGRLLVAHANTFWLPPQPGQRDDIDWYADFRRLQAVPLADLHAAGRAAAMTHDARVFLIRREMYFKYRWLTSVEQVRGLELERIINDPHFVGPRPDWA